MKTGNIAIEYQSYGKPSGIEATESDYWFHNLCVGDKEYCTLVFHTDVLKTIVKELDTFKTVSGRDIKVEISGRRAGDPAVLTADATKAKTELGWEIKFGDLEKIISTAWEWHNRYPNGYE